VSELLQPIAQKADPPCLGKEQDLREFKCQRCPLKKECAQLMGLEVTHIRLSDYPWSFLPPGYQKLLMACSEAERLYYESHETVFKKPPRHGLGEEASRIANWAAQVPCSTRLYILTCMVGFVETQKLLTEEGKALPSEFRPSLLTQKRGYELARRFLGICRRRYGSEHITSLDKIVDGDYGESDLSRRFLGSEVLAGKFLIEYRIWHAGSAWSSLYAKHETDLDPDWLAIEKTYRPFLMEGDRTPFRSNVLRRLNHLKKHRRAAIAVFRCREATFPEALEKVLSGYGLKPSEFWLGEGDIDAPLKVWTNLGGAIQHLEMLKAFDGQRSRFSSLLERTT
jgi:hypothetical protein